MIKSYLLLSVRNLLKDKLYAGINTVGLAVGLATFFIIYAWVAYELSFDDYHPGKKEIYRVATTWDDLSQEGVASTYPMIKERVLEHFPEIVSCTRLFNTELRNEKTLIGYRDKVFSDHTLYYADSTFFKVFSYKILKRQSENLFVKTNSIVLTEKTAAKIFGEEDPIGKILKIGKNKEMEVTGVIENIPGNTHFNFDLLAAMQSHPWVARAENNVWSGIVFHTYIKVRKGTDVSVLQQKISRFLDAFPNDPNGHGKALNMVLQPIQDIHLESDFKMELQANGNSVYIYLFITIAIAVLVIACINHINLATARYTTRAKEVGVRKVLGAKRHQLVTQFLAESVMMAIAAFVITFVLIHALRSLLFHIAGYEFLPPSFTLPVIAAAAGVTLLIALIAGIFPALLLSGFSPLERIKPASVPFPAGASLRKGLVTFQFTLSIILTLCTAITYRQLQFVREVKAGYDKEQVMIVDLGHAELGNRYKELKTRMLTNSFVTHATATSQLPMNILEEENINVTSTEAYAVHYISVDEDFFETLLIGIKAGKENIANISPENGRNQFVLNESAIKMIGWSENNALNQNIVIRHGSMEPGPVIGVVSDFYFQSLHNPIGPLVIEFTPAAYQYLLLKIAPGYVEEAVTASREAWKEIAVNIPFEYSFLTLEYDNLYRSEKQVGKLFLAFASVALLIAVLGIFGLASFSAERRTREIGIRKVLGASGSNIVYLISGDFMKLLLISFFLAIPAGYYFQTTWSQNFAYRANVSVGVFVAAGLVNYLLAWAVLLYHGIKASRKNPADILKCE